VIRKTNTKIIVQIISAKVVGDMTQASAVSTELGEHGWDAGKKNLPAAYLTGLLAGLRAKSRGIHEAVLDIGLNPPTKGSRIYAAVKGIVDAGLNVPHNPEVLPDEERLAGNHVVAALDYFSGQETNMFSSLGKKKTTITGIPKKFEAVKKALLAIPAADLKKKKKAKPPTTPAKAKAAKKKKEKPAQKPPRAIPRKPKPKKLLARGKGKKGKKK